MDQETLRGIIYNLRHHKTEFHDVEVKAANNGNPNELWKTFSAFANYSKPGIIICGLDEKSNFRVVDIYSPSNLQEHITSVASQMEPALRPCINVMEFEGKTLVIIEIDPIPLEMRPCYYRPKGMYEGSYIRVSISTRKMTSYEINTCLSNRSQPNFDKEPIKEATIDDLDRTRLDLYLAKLNSTRLKAQYTKLPLEQELKALNVLSDDNGTLRPSLAGLLVFGERPQRFEPQLVITFLQHYGTTETELPPGGERFLDNRKFEGPIDEMTSEAYEYILSRTRKGSRIQGVYRQDIPEYPEIAIREAIINATAHRDYSIPARGSHIQIKLFSDRLEVISPGGLYGNVALEDIVNGESTRNRFLMHFLEDLNVVENRGSGIDAILDATRSANLVPPKFEDNISSFKITLYNAQLQSDEEKILAYVHEHGSIRRIECQTLLGKDSRQSKHILQKMKDSGLLELKGTTRGAYYVIP